MADSMSRSEMILIRKAAREGWPMSEAKRRETIARLRQVVDDPQRSARDKQKAIQTLVALGCDVTPSVDGC